MSLLEGAYNYVISILDAGAVTDNAWLTANIDKIQGIVTIVLCSIVLAVAIIIGLAVLRWFGRLFDWRR